MKMNIEIQPWLTPNFVIGKLPPRERHAVLQPSPPSWPLAEVDADMLSEMCDVFRAEVFAKAGKADPRAPR